MNIIQHVSHWNYRELALYASAVLAADKGIASDIEDFGACLLLVASDGKAIVFTP
jgi:hypothetical protein